MFKPVFSNRVAYFHLAMNSVLASWWVAVCHDVLRRVLNGTEGSVSHHDVPF